LLSCAVMTVSTAATSWRSSSSVVMKGGLIRTVSPRGGRVTDPCSMSSSVPVSAPRWLTGVTPPSSPVPACR
jgi:hypothetical protein